MNEVRGRAYTRHCRFKKIQEHKKKDLDISLVFNGSSGIERMTIFHCDGKYNKGKIHCSCFLCSAKTKTHGYKPSDIKKLEKIKYDLKNFEFEH